MNLETYIFAMLAFIVGALIGKIFSRPVTIENHTHIVTDDYGEEGESIPVGYPIEYSTDDDDDDVEDDDDQNWRR